MTHFFPRIKAACFKHPLVTGSFLLTLAGLLSRLIGFFYRIYLSQTFGEESMGIYQLIGPIVALSFSLTAAGFQTSISKFVAECTERHKVTKDKVTEAKPFFLGLSISLPLSVLLMFFLQRNAVNIATHLLQEPRTASLLRILALSLPLSALHACVNGYFYGRKNAGVPAICQLIEQICRVLSVYLICTIQLRQGNTPSLNVTVIGILIGEIVSTIICTFVLLHHLRNTSTGYSVTFYDQNPSVKIVTYGMLLSMALPLIANRITINLLQSVETISIPAKLRLFGYDPATALSVYGVLTGMAFPLLFFPNAITSAFAVLLLPMISERISLGDKKGIRKLTIQTIQSCSLLGFFCMLLFLVLGNQLGMLLFHSELAGIFIKTLSFICPFLYLNNTLSAILQGMGKVLTLFFINVSALVLRLLFIFTFIPTHGIKGYLWGLLVSQIFQSTCYLFFINRTQKL